MTGVIYLTADGALVPARADVDVPSDALRIEADQVDLTRLVDLLRRLVTERDAAVADADRLAEALRLQAGWRTPQGESARALALHDAEVARYGA